MRLHLRARHRRRTSDSPIKVTLRSRDVNERGKPYGPESHDEGFDAPSVKRVYVLYTREGGMCVREEFFSDRDFIARASREAIRL